MTNCTFGGNSADKGGGMYNYDNSSPTLTNCTFSRNSADYGGGGMCSFNSAPTVANCAFGGNSAAYCGGGMFTWDSSPTMTNCTFGGNSAANGMAVACDSWGDPSTVVMANCVLWDGRNEIGNNDGSTITITYSDIQGGWPGEGCIDSDPAFVRDPDDGGDG